MKNIIRLDEYLVKSVFLEVKEIFWSLENEYHIEVKVSDEKLLDLLTIIYNYYLKKEIICDYKEIVLDHFNDLAIISIENDCLVDMNFIISNFCLLEMFYSRVEVIPEEVFEVTSKVLKKEGK